MNKKQVGDTFIDHFFRKWQVITVGDDFYDCQFIECLDGNIRDTPQFKLFDSNDELFASEKIVSEIRELRSRPIDPTKLQRAKDILSLLNQGVYDYD